MTITAHRPATRRRRAGAWQVVEYQAVVARTAWRSHLVVNVLTPLLYVIALGVGLGVVVDRHGDQLGVPYLVFVAPAFLTAACLQTAAADSSWPVMGGFRWQRVYHGIAATPLRPRQICDGVLLWVTLRVLLGACLYLAVIAASGGAQRWQVVLAVPAGTLAAIAFASTIMALSASLEQESNAFNIVFRFVVTPMFLFSGTFYPISQLPAWGQVLAHLSPLWHGTELARAAAIGGESALGLLGHVTFLLSWLALGLALARWRFRVRLTR